MQGKASNCEKWRRHRLANGPLPARKIHVLADSTHGDFLCPRTTTCAEQPPPSPCALSSFPSLAAFLPASCLSVSQSVVLQVLHSPPASPSIRYRDQRSFQWDIASSAQRGDIRRRVARPRTHPPSHPSSSNAVTAAIRRKEGRPDADDSADAASTWRRHRGGRRQRNCSSSAKRSPEMEGAPPRRRCCRRTNQRAVT